MDNTASPNTAQQYIKSFVASSKTFTFETASKGAASTVDTLHWVNGLGPMRAAAVADGDSTIVMDPDAATFFDTDSALPTPNSLSTRRKQALTVEWLLELLC